MPGTAASIAGACLYYLFCGDTLSCLFLTAVCIILGFLVSGKAERLFARKDASQIVIDEAAGMLVSLFLLPCDIRIIIAAFVLFRLFDILKPFPLKRLQELPGSLGVMSDDLLAAVYTNCILQVVIKFAIYKAS
ncbi:MAG: phosphatidylglycerophosphatase A [Candidatus Omnitrophota bacterium]